MIQKGLPRHEQISTWLRDKITSNEFGPNDKLPSENEISKEFDVSRVTVRHALQTLEAEGVIYRRQGLGSFVQPNLVSQRLTQLTDFMEDMASAGIKARSEVLYFGPGESDEEVAHQLGVSHGTPLIRIDRLRLGDGFPVAFDTTWLPLLYGQFLDRHDLTTETISGILESHYDIDVQRGRYRIEAQSATPEIAGHLGVDPGTSLLVIQRVIYTIGGKVIFVQRRYYRSDRVAYCLDLNRTADVAGVAALEFSDFEPEFKN